jgi:RHS repeat-associated protein
MTVTRYYVTSDAMGSVTAILDEDGNALERRSYEAFGEMTCMLPDGSPIAESPTGLDVGFQGQIRDDVTGLYQMGVRWCSPVMGRWLQADFIGLNGGVNLYAFVLNRPTVLTDFLGDDPGGADDDSEALNKVTSCPRGQLAEHEVYQGKIAYSAAAFILGIGTFKGVIVSDSDPVEKYEIEGFVNGVGYQAGIVKGEINVKFVEEKAHDLIGSNGGFWLAGVSVGAGIIDFASASASLAASREGFGDGNIKFEGAGVSNSLDPSKPEVKPGGNVGVSYSLSFFGITVSSIKRIR